MDALPYIIQIAFFGAAGSSFIAAHLKNRAADNKGDAPPMQRWRIFRHPHLSGDTREQRLMRLAAASQTAWGFCFLGGAIVTPLVFRWLHIGA